MPLEATHKNQCDLSDTLTQKCPTTKLIDYYWLIWSVNLSVWWHTFALMSQMTWFFCVQLPDITQTSLRKNKFFLLLVWSWVITFLSVFKGLESWFSGYLCKTWSSTIPGSWFLLGSDYMVKMNCLTTKTICTHI